MFIESLVLENFQCFGPSRTVIRLDQGLTTFIGANGSGKTAACKAMLRLFGITSQERAIRADDFHVPADETNAPPKRELTIEVILAFPELEEEDEDEEDDGQLGDPGRDQAAVVPSGAVAECFQRMAATPDGEDLKVRIVLKAKWEDDGTVDGAITDERMVVTTFDEDFGDDEWVRFDPALRSRIQMIYIPASRDGARQVTTFLRSRLWRAAQWTTRLQDVITMSASQLGGEFTAQPPVVAVQTALTARWQELHDAGTHATPKFRLIDDDVNQLVRDAELMFEPDHTGRARPARLLSDGQRSLLHLALTAATLDVEAGLVDGSHSAEFLFDLARLPDLTLVAVEEPENSLSPFFLSRIVTQLQELSATWRGQAVIASHSPSTLNRIKPENIRYFRVDSDDGTSAVREITLPADGTDAGKYLREAVQAHPELYFAKFVVLGEGDTEQVVIPRVAQARGIALDPSFVAVVPLGGRHSNHMWRLLNDLDIPHATLLDLDYGRAGGGAGRLRDACKRLTRLGRKPLNGLSDYGRIDDITDDLELDDLKPIVRHLQKFGIFFASPLDLDYTMLCKYPRAYEAVGGSSGPSLADATKAVLGDNPTDPTYWAATTTRTERLRWYRHLFLTRSKPSTHLRALSQLTDEQLKDAPTVILSLIDRIAAEVEL